MTSRSRLYLVPKPEPIHDKSTHRERVKGRLLSLVFIALCVIGGSLAMIYVQGFGS